MEELWFEEKVFVLKLPRVQLYTLEYMRPKKRI